MERAKQTMIRYGEAFDSWDDPQFDFDEAIRDAHHQFQLFCQDSHQFFADRALLPAVEFNYTHVEEKDWKLHADALVCIKCFCDVRGSKSGLVWHGHRNCYLCGACERKEVDEGRDD